MASERMVVLGRLGAPWGVKGGLKVESYTDPPTGLLNYPVWYVGSAARGWETMKVKAGRAHGGRSTLVVELDGVDSPERARLFTEREIAQPRSAMPEPATGEYYWEDLMGCQVFLLDGRALGVVSHFLEFPANPVMVVKEGAKEHWLPLVAPHLKQVDLSERRVVVDWEPEG